MPPDCEAVLRTVGGAGGGDYHHPNEMNENGLEAGGVVRGSPRTTWTLRPYRSR